MQVHGRGLDGGEFRLGVAEGRWTPPDGDGPSVDAGRWCVPGMADAHAHLSADELDLVPAEPAGVIRRGFAALEGGVFLCLDKGWSDDTVITVGDSPPEPFPTVQAAGTIIAPPGGYYPDFAPEVGEEDLVAAVAQRAGRGGGWVKLIGDWPRKGPGPLANYTEEALAAAVSVAQAAGARVAIHTMAEDVPGMAVRAGVDSIEHGLYLDEDDLAALAARDGVWVPTVLRVREVLARMRPGSRGAEILGRGLARMRGLLPLAAEMGLAVLCGTDLAVPSGRVGAEAAVLVDAGLPTAATLDGLTTRAFQVAGEPAGLRPGLPADLVAFPGDPMEDPAVLCSPVLVIRRGTVLTDRRPS